MSSRLRSIEGEMSQLRIEKSQGGRDLELAQAEVRRYQRHQQEMEKCVAGEQEKLRETRDQIRLLKEQILEMQNLSMQKDQQMQSFILFINFIGLP